MWWGFSRALDLLDESFDTYGSKTKDQEGGNEQNILLVGQSDCRHILKTLACKYRHEESGTVKLYVYEPLLENVARDLLFLTLALEPPEHIGITDKTLLFMELYGNSLLRPAAANYLTKISKRLLNIITDFNYAHQVFPSICLEKLKYKERDQLEIIFKYWSLNDNSFDILAAWDERLRKHLGVRYDSRKGVFDWDYHMRYRCYGADTLNLQEYKRFREKGISFYFHDTDPCISNSSLASVIYPSGSKILSCGYLGDIVTGPYVTFGFKCEDEDMLKKVNGQMHKTATDITERNLMRIFHEIEKQKPFVPLPEDNSRYPVGVFMDESAHLKIQSNSDSESGTKKIEDKCSVYQSLSMNNIQVIFMSKSALNDFSRKPEYKNLFDKAFIAQALILKHFKPDNFKMMKPKGKIIVDTPKFLLHYRKEDLEKFKIDLEDLMINSQCKLSGPYNYEEAELVQFTVET